MAAVRDLAVRRFAHAAAVVEAGLLGKPGPHEDLFDISESDYTAVWILHGSGWYRDEEAGTIAVSAGDLVQRLPGVRHSTWGDDRRDWLEIYLTLPAGVFAALADVGAVERNPVLHPGVDRVLRDEILPLVAAVRACDEDGWPELLARMVAAVCSLHARHRRRAAVEDRAGQLAADACRMLAGDPARPPPPALVARRLGLSYERFRKIFVERVGIGPSAYQRRRRVEAACAILLDPRRSVAEVAATLGFPDVQAFTRIFSREIGQPPARWRRRR